MSDPASGAYEKLADAPLTDEQQLALEAGIGHEREYVRFWSRALERTHKPTA